jgi:hypothetical protein
MISSACQIVDKNCTFGGYYGVISGKFFPVFQDYLSVAFSRVKYLKRKNS